MNQPQAAPVPIPGHLAPTTDPYPDLDGSVLRQLQELQRMTVRELQAKHVELYGLPTRSHHKTQLLRRLSWRVQELRWGGLSDELLARLRAIESDSDARYLPPRKPIQRQRIVELPRPERTKLPAVGTVLEREFAGEIHSVTICDDGVEYRGRRFKSLSGVARSITNTNWNGRRFFGLVDAKGVRL